MRNSLRALSLFSLFACAPRATSLTADHPASPQAPIGLLAGPPAALRPGVAQADVEPPPASPAGHDHHRMPSNPPTAEPTNTETQTSEPDKTGPNKTAPNTTEPKKAEPKKAEPKKAEPKKAEPKKTEPKKTEPKKTEPKKAEPKKTEPKKAEPTPTPDPHQGHDMSGHEHH